MSNADADIARLEVAIALGRALPNLTAYRLARAVHDLARFGDQLHRRYEAQCSYAWADTDSYRDRTDRLEAKTLKLAEEIGITVEHQRDPRGWPLILCAAGSEYRLGG